MKAHETLGAILKGLNWWPKGSLTAQAARLRGNSSNEPQRFSVDSRGGKMSLAMATLANSESRSGNLSFSSVQLLSRGQLFVTPWTAAHQASLSPRVYSNSCPWSQWCHPTISSSVIPFSSCLQSFPASASSQMSQLFASGGQSTGVSASTSVLPMNTQDWSPLGWTGWIS